MGSPRELRSAGSTSSSSWTLKAMTTARTVLTAVYFLQLVKNNFEHASLRVSTKTSLRRLMITATTLASLLAPSDSRITCGFDLQGWTQILKQAGGGLLADEV